MEKQPLTYNVMRLDLTQPDWWKRAEEAEVCTFPWDGAYRPRTVAGAAYCDSALCVHMETNETNLRMETKGFGRVHTDSCMEFFLAPEAGSDKYLNYEFNPAGGICLSVGKARHGRELLNIENYRDLFAVKTAVFESGWTLEFRVPLEFLQRFFSVDLKPGQIMRGNFYKCGDETEHPHFGCWSPIDLPSPDFHCPDFFGTLVFV